ncbi:pyridoxal phosphate-dependent aminotransferase [Flindersiella endophytica]
MSHTVRLHLNELAYAPSSETVSGSAVALGGVHRYPDRDSPALRAALAAQLDVAPDWVIMGAGSAAVVYQAIVAAGPGAVVMCWPGFDAIESITAALRVPLHRAPLRDYACDLDRLAATVTSETRIAIVCSPNVPTGGVVGHAAVEAFVCAMPAGVVVLIDEAYAEFAVSDLDALALVRRYPDVVVTRTFSKAYGLAGLRVGYGIAQPRLAGRIAAAGLPFQVTVPAERAAVAALRDQPGLRERVRRTVATRREMAEALRAVGAPVVEGHGNFVWLPLGDQAVAAAQVLEEQGILVKPVRSYGVRVAVGTPADIELLVAAWEKYTLAD